MKKNHLFITLLFLGLLLNVTCSKSNPFKAPDLYEPEDFDYAVEIMDCLYCTDLCYSITFGYGDPSWDGLTTLKVDGVEYENDDSYYGSGVHMISHILLVPGNVYNIEVSTPLSGASVAISIPYEMKNLHLPDNVDISKKHTLTWEADGSSEILMVLRDIRYWNEGSCPLGNYFHEPPVFMEVISPKRRSYTFPGMDMNSIHVCDAGVDIVYWHHSFNYIISNRFIFFAASNVNAIAIPYPATTIFAGENSMQKYELAVPLDKWNSPPRVWSNIINRQKGSQR